MAFQCGSSLLRWCNQYTTVPVDIVPVVVLLILAHPTGGENQIVDPVPRAEVPIAVIVQPLVADGQCRDVASTSVTVSRLPEGVWLTSATAPAASVISNVSAVTMGSDASEDGSTHRSNRHPRVHRT